MSVDDILKRDADLRRVAAHGAYARHPVGVMYIRAIAAAERALIEAVRAWVVADTKGGWESEAAAADTVEQAYRALLAAMEEAQR